MVFTCGEFGWCLVAFVVGCSYLGTCECCCYRLGESSAYDCDDCWCFLFGNGYLTFLAIIIVVGSTCVGFVCGSGIGLAFRRFIEG